MGFNKLSKKQLIELIEGIKDDVEFIEKCTLDCRQREANEWFQGRADAYEQSAKWINERISKFEQQSTRP